MEETRKSCGRASCTRAKWSDTVSFDSFAKRNARARRTRSNLTLRVSPVPLTIGYRKRERRKTCMRMFNARVGVDLSVVVHRRWTSSFYFKVTRFSRIFATVNSRPDISYNVCISVFHYLQL